MWSNINININNNNININNHNHNHNVCVGDRFAGSCDSMRCLACSSVSELRAINRAAACVLRRKRISGRPLIRLWWRRARAGCTEEEEGAAAEERRRICRRRRRQRQRRRRWRWR